MRTTLSYEFTNLRIYPTAFATVGTVLRFGMALAASLSLSAGAHYTVGGAMPRRATVLCSHMLEAVRMQLDQDQAVRMQLDQDQPSSSASSLPEAAAVVSLRALAIPAARARPPTFTYLLLLPTLLQLFLALPRLRAPSGRGFGRFCRFWLGFCGRFGTAIRSVA